MSTEALRHTHDVVNLSVVIDGEVLPDTVPVDSIEIIHQVNRIPITRIKILDGDIAQQEFSQSSGELFLPGNEIEISAGYRDEIAPVFSGVIYKQRIVVKETKTFIVVECRDSAVKMTLNRNSRYHEEMTDSDVVEALIGEYALDADVEAIDVIHPQLLQYDASDWDFMISRLEANGHLCVVNAGLIKSFKPKLDGDPVADAIFADTLMELDAEFDARLQAPAIKTIAWDPAEQSLQEIEAADPGWENNGDLTADDMAAATERGDMFLLHGGALAGDALQSWADGELLRSRVAATRGRLRIRGVPIIQLGDLIQLTQISDRINGSVLITGMRHEFSNNCWLTDLEFGLPQKKHVESFDVNHLPAAGLNPAINGLQVGVVTQLADDPAGENRVRVKIPTAGEDEQGLWARVSTLDAGPERGTFFRPEVDDEVVLGFFHNDPAFPVILGMLHSSAKTPPIEPTEDNHEKAYVSREGLTLHFHDEEKVMTMETPAGNKIILSDADEGIVFEDQHGNKIEMNADGISLTSAADLKAEASGDFIADAANIGLTASIECKAEGSATAVLTSGGTLEVSGALVQIN